jgi:hypothetical protein
MMQWINVSMISHLALNLLPEYSVRGWDVTTSRCGHVPNWSGCLLTLCVRTDSYYQAYEGSKIVSKSTITLTVNK